MHVQSITKRYNPSICELVIHLRLSYFIIMLYIRVILFPRPPPPRVHSNSFVRILLLAFFFWLRGYFCHCGCIYECDTHRTNAVSNINVWVCVFDSFARDDGFRMVYWPAYAVHTERPIEDHLPNKWINSKRIRIARGLAQSVSHIRWTNAHIYTACKTPMRSMHNDTGDIICMMCTQCIRFNAQTPLHAYRHNHWRACMHPHIL